VISSSQEPLPENTQNYQETNIHISAGFEKAIPVKKRRQSYALDRLVTGSGVK
jgi:adenylate cyclase class IV